MKQVWVTALGFLLLAGVFVSAQDNGEIGNNDFALKAVPSLDEVSLGATYEVTVQLTSQVAGIEAWSFGLCIDKQLQKVVSALPGADLDFVNFGSTPDYWTINNEWDGGVTQAVVLDTRGDAQLGVIPESDPLSVLVLELEPTEELVGETAGVQFCDTVGDPPVETLVVVGNQAFNPGTQEPSQIPVVRDPPTLFAYTDDLYNLVTSTPEPVETVVRLRSTRKLYGFSLGVAHNGDKLQIESVELAQELLDALGGEEPDYFAINTDPAGGPGFTAGVVFEIPQEPPSGGDLLFIKNDRETPSVEAFVVKYSEGPEAQENDEAELDFTGELGDPKVRLLFDLGEEHTPNTRNSKVLITSEPLKSPFMRGEMNGDGILTITDALVLLRSIFLGEPLGFDCPEAQDCNDDGAVDISDPTYLLSYLFVGGPPPPFPLGECGSLPEGPDNLGCISFPVCE